MDAKRNRLWACMHKVRWKRIVVLVGVCILAAAAIVISFAFYMAVDSFGK